MDNIQLFIECQLFNFAILQSLIKNNDQLSPEQKEAAENAMVVVAQTVDKTLATHPEYNPKMIEDLAKKLGI